MVRTINSAARRAIGFLTSSNKDEVRIGLEIANEEVLDRLDNHGVHTTSVLPGKNQKDLASTFPSGSGCLQKHKCRLDARLLIRLKKNLLSIALRNDSNSSFAVFCLGFLNDKALVPVFDDLLRIALSSKDNDLLFQTLVALLKMGRLGQAIEIKSMSLPSKRQNCNFARKYLEWVKRSLRRHDKGPWKAQRKGHSDQPVTAKRNR